MKLNLPRDNTPCKDLLKQTGDMSINQLTAYHTLLQVHKTTISEKPEYLAKKLVLKKPNAVFPKGFPHRQLNTITVNRNLTASRAGYCYRDARLWNKLTVELRSCQKTTTFRTMVKKWIKENVPVKPP